MFEYRAGWYGWSVATSLVSFRPGTAGNASFRPCSIIPREPINEKGRLRISSTYPFSDSLRRHDQLRKASNASESPNHERSQSWRNGPRQHHLKNHSIPSNLAADVSRLQRSTGAGTHQKGLQIHMYVKCTRIRVCRWMVKGAGRRTSLSCGAKDSRKWPQI